jgi:uncharacterized cofD-like protein
MTSPPTSGGTAETTAVAIGGGHGTARSLLALRQVVDRVTAVVTVADDGGSSGRLRRDLGVPPPGDLRMALTSLAADSDLRQLVNYRFPRGELAGHSLGNLILIALQDLTGQDLVAGLDRLAALLDVRGRVLPCTTTPITLHAQTAGGAVTGQVAVAATPRLQRVWLDPPDAVPPPEVLAAIAAADLIVLGPGSLYTSLLPNLLVPRVVDAINGSTARVVLVSNLREQPGETEGMTLVDHLDALQDHVGELHLDVLVAHEGEAPSGGGIPLVLDEDRLATRAEQVRVLDLLDGDDGHDPRLLAALFRDLLPG